MPAPDPDLRRSAADEDIFALPADDEPSRPRLLTSLDRTLGGDRDGAGADQSESPGADLFKRWLWLPGPVAFAYLAAVAARQASSTRPQLIVAAAACLPAQALAWSWASHRWLRWADWRLVASVLLAAISLISVAAMAAEHWGTSGDRIYRLGIGPNDVVAAAGALWVSDPVDEVVYRLPDNEKEPITPIPVSGAFELAASGSTIWVSQAGGANGLEQPPGLTRLRADGSVVMTYPLHAHPADIAATERWVWLAFVDTGEVGRMDTTSGRLDVWLVGQSPASLAIDGTSVWVTDIGSSRVLRIDAATGDVMEKLATGLEPVGIDAEAGAVWIANANSNTVTYYDARRTVRQFRVPAQPTDIAIHDGTLWIVSRDAQKLIAVDARSGESKREISLGGKPNKIEVVGSDVVVTNPGDGTIQRYPRDVPSGD